MELTRAERLALFIERLAAEPPASDAHAALNQLRRVLNEVEDEHSGVPYQPANWLRDGRLYPPMDDRVHPVRELPGALIAFSLAHTSYFGVNGAIRVYDARRYRVILDKAGADGKLYDQ